MHQQEPRGEGEVAGGTGEMHAARQPRAAAFVISVKHGEGVRLDVGVELVLVPNSIDKFGLSSGLNPT